MEQRTLGEVQTSAMGLGCMPMTASYGRVDRNEAAATLEAALEAGVRLFDTAELYGAGRNEAFIGPVLRRRRSEVLIATKTGIASTLGYPVGLDGRPETIQRALKGSLRRLGVAEVDLYYLHRVDPKVPVEESIGAMGELVEAGLVRHLGISEPSSRDLERAAATAKLSALQIEWSLLSRQHEQSLIPLARRLGIGIVAYSPLGRGMLTGDARATTRLGLLDYRRLLPRWNKRNLAANLEQVQIVREVARRHDATPGQVALAWVLARGSDVVPIPGTKRRRWLSENIDALQLTLEPADLARLEDLRPVGERMTPSSPFHRD